jgi:hypothetical protein
MKTNVFMAFLDKTSIFFNNLLLIERRRTGKRSRALNRIIDGQNAATERTISRNSLVILGTLLNCKTRPTHR